MPFRDGLTFMVYDKQLVIFTSIHSYVVEILEFIRDRHVLLSACINLVENVWHTPSTQRM